MKKLRNDNKGFTLVELIVVLVILAILAAILVPALLGYIDEARNKQLQLHGKGVYTAAQAQASKMYGYNIKIDEAGAGKGLDVFGTQVATLSEISSFGETAVAYIAFKGTEGKDSYTVIDILFSEDGETGVWLGDAEAWTYKEDMTKALTAFKGDDENKAGYILKIAYDSTTAKKFVATEEFKAGA